MPAARRQGPARPTAQAPGRAAVARSDVCSWGAVLFEMATGERAFAAEDGVLERVEAGLAEMVALETLPELLPPAAD